ncbi:MAG: universal stress protein [Chitinophagaceae bacterium]|nr:MAG: universal stress protein [Chitinophagaceae bacterium]
MKKIIAAFDGLRFSESTLSYAIDLAKKAGAHLVGIFLEDPHLHSYSIAEMQTYAGESFDVHMRTLNKRDDEKRQTAVDRFRHACESGGITCSIHRDRNSPIRELLHETIYADLLVIKASEGLHSKQETPPTSFVRQLLQEAQCPVLLVPNVYHHIESIKLLYDGAPVSVSALRAFSYLFESFKEKDTEVISVKTEDDNLHLPDGRLIKEFATRHFPKAAFTVLKGFPDYTIERYLRTQNRHALIVLGAYRRSALSRLFRPSMADGLLQDLKMPLFIAHYGF